MLLRRALWGRPARQLCLTVVRGSGCGEAAEKGVVLRAGRHVAVTLHRNASSVQSVTGTGAAIQDRSRARQADLTEALADLDALVDSGGSSGSLDSVLLGRSDRKNDADQHRGADELTDLLAMVKQRDQLEEVGAATREEWGSGGSADLSDRSRDALSTSVRSRTRAELADALRQEEIEDARARYKKKRWARNWVVKRTSELHRRKADAAEVEHAIQEMITRGDLPTVVTYNTLIAACGRSKSAVRSSDAKRAYNAFVEMKRRGLVPTASTYSTLLTTLSQTDSSSRPKSMRRHSAAAARIEATASDDMFEKVWLEMAGYLSDHARGLVDMKERERTVLCNSALNAALRRGAGQSHLGRGREKFAQMREYMRAHGVVHDAVGYTLLVRVAKQELDEAVRETEILANRSRQRQLHRMTRVEAAEATAAAVTAERRAALALRNLLTLWMVLGAADARVQAAGNSSMLDSRLTNGLLAALASAARLIDADPLALTVAIGKGAHDENGGDRQQQQQRDGTEQPAVDMGSLDFELGYDVDDSSPEPLNVAEEHDDGDASFGNQSSGGDDSESEDSSSQWMPRSGFGEERRARQRKAIVAMSWQLWSALQTQLEVNADARAKRAGSSTQNVHETKTDNNRNHHENSEARVKQDEREGVAHVLSTLTGVMLRAGDGDDQGAALQAVMQHPHVRRDPVFWAVMMEASAEQAGVAQCEMLLESFERALRTHDEEGEDRRAGRDSRQSATRGVGTRHFNALLRAYARGAGNSDEDSVCDLVWIQLLRMQDEYGLVPDEYTISSVLMACERDRNPDRAMEALRLALRLATGVKRTNNGQSSTTGGAQHVMKPSMPLLRHAHTIFNYKWGWRRRPEALEIIWRLWALGSADAGGEPTVGGSEFPWWDGHSQRAGRGSRAGVGTDRPLGAGQGVGPRVATVRSNPPEKLTAGGGGYKRVDDGSVTDVDEVAVDKLLRKRHLARRRGDYEVADKLLKRLFDVHGVVVSDDDCVWAAAAAVAKDKPEESGASSADTRVIRAIRRLRSGAR